MQSLIPQEKRPRRLPEWLLGVETPEGRKMSRKRPNENLRLATLIRAIKKNAMRSLTIDEFRTAEAQRFHLWKVSAREVVAICDALLELGDACSVESLTFGMSASIDDGALDRVSNLVANNKSITDLIVNVSGFSEFFLPDGSSTRASFLRGVAGLLGAVVDRQRRNESPIRHLFMKGPFSIDVVDAVTYSRWPRPGERQASSAVAATAMRAIRSLTAIFETSRGGLHLSGMIDLPAPLWLERVPTIMQRVGWLERLLPDPQYVDNIGACLVLFRASGKHAISVAERELQPPPEPSGPDDVATPFRHEAGRAIDHLTRVAVANPQVTGNRPDALRTLFHETRGRNTLIDKQRLALLAVDSQVKPPLPSAGTDTPIGRFFASNLSDRYHVFGLVNQLLG